MSANGISHLSTKQARQAAKLAAAATKRGTAGVSFRARQYLDTTELPTVYSGNAVVDQPNVGGLVLGRPWVSTPPFTFYERDLKAGAALTYTASVLGQTLDVKSTNFDGSPTSGSYIKVNGSYVASDTSIGQGYIMGRGHTLAVINPTTGATVSVLTYDTYGLGTTTLQTALNAVANGYIIVLATYDASLLDSGMRTVLQTKYGSTNPGTWVAERHSDIFVGIKV